MGKLAFWGVFAWVVLFSITSIAVESAPSWRVRFNFQSSSVTSIADFAELLRANPMLDREAIRPYGDSLRVRYQDGMSWEVHREGGVFKFITPFTSDFAGLEKRLDRDFFARVGRGNFRIERGSVQWEVTTERLFGGDVMLLRNLIVELANHPERARIGGRKGLHQLPAEKRAELRRLIWHADAGVIGHPEELAEKLQRQVFQSESDGSPLAFENWLTDRDSGPRRLGLFGLGEPASAADLLHDIQIWNAEFQKLRRYRNKAIAWADIFFRGQGLSGYEAGRQLRDWITKAGLPVDVVSTKLFRAGSDLRELQAWKRGFFESGNCSSQLGALGAAVR